MPHLHELFHLSQEQAHHSLWFVALETFILITGFTLIVELAGRKTVAQMTMLQMIVTIGVGESLLLPVIDKDFSIVRTFVIVTVLIAFVILTEWLELKFNWFERMFTNKSKLVIEDGKINEKNLKKLRLSVDQLEIALRNIGIESFEQLKVCTVEANGNIGYQYKPEHKPVTRKDLMDFLKGEYTIEEKINGDIFEEIKNDEHKIKSKQQHVKKFK